jgi:tetratricopeptide (TPR) repeat protein
METLATPFTGHLASEQGGAFLQLRAKLEGTRAIIACDIGDKETALFYGQRQFSFQMQLAMGEGTRRLAHASYILGRVPMLAGNFAAAERNFDSCAHILRSLPNFNKLQLFHPLYGHGWNHYLQGKYSQALRYWVHALKDRVDASEFLGGDDGGDPQ